MASKINTKYFYGTRTSKGYDGFGRLNSTSYLETINGKEIRYRDTNHGDHHTPTSYDHGRVSSFHGESRTTKQTYRFRGGPWGYHCDTASENFGADYIHYSPPYVGITETKITLSDGYDYSNLVNAALADLNSSKVDTAMVLAEINKTGSYLAKVVKTGARVLMDIKHMRYSRALKRLGITKKGFKSLKTPSSALLQYRYAINPLLKDIEGAAAVYQGSIRELDHAFISGSSGMQVEFNSNTNEVLNGGEWTHESIHKRKVKVYAKIVNPDLAAVKHLTSINPLVIGWELVPFSFVADWFLPIGDMLQASTAMAGLESAGWYYGNKLEIESKYSYSEPMAPTSSNNYCPIYPVREASAFGRTEMYSRLASLTTPGARVPTLEQGLSSNINIATAIALIASLRK